MRLDKYVMNALQITKNDAKILIKKKNIYVNDEIVSVCDFQVKDEQVRYLNKDIYYKENIYLVMNKPQGCVCAKQDNVSETVMDIITDYDVRKLCIIGRLDKDTTGLLLITTDGALVHTLTSPKYNKEKEYLVEADNTFTMDDIKKASEGIEIIDEDGSIYKCKKALLKIDEEDNHKCSLIITEGKFHQVKKMCKALNKEVLKLKRIRIGSLFLDEGLEEGQYREITNEELELIQK